MRIGYSTNGKSCEYEMQDKLKEWLIAKELKFIDEFYIGEVGRKPDFLVWKVGNGLINIEAKCNDLVCVMRQLKDNALYCDYSFAFIPDYCLTPKAFKEGLLKNGFGLLIYNCEHEIITEVLEAHQNKNINRRLRSDVISYIDKALIVRKKKTDVDTQIRIF